VVERSLKNGKLEKMRNRLHMRLLLTLCICFQTWVCVGVDECVLWLSCAQQKNYLINRFLGKKAFKVFKDA
jgi:hypothetical protein